MAGGIIVAGNLCVDYIKTVDGYPRPGMLAAIQSIRRAAGGSVPNVGISLKQLDPALEVRAVGLVGEDENGDYLLGVLAESGMDISGMSRAPALPTPFTDGMTDGRNGERTFFYAKGANAAFGPEHIRFDGFTGCSILHIAYALLLDRLDAPDAECGTVMARVLREATGRGLLTSLDVVSAQGGRFAETVVPALPQCDYLIVNEIEAGGICGISLRDGSGALLQQNAGAACGAILRNH
jgi:sugar/nucleoside kinase (ribokinase family)